MTHNSGDQAICQRTLNQSKWKARRRKRNGQILFTLKLTGFWRCRECALNGNSVFLFSLMPLDECKSSSLDTMKWMEKYEPSWKCRRRKSREEMESFFPILKRILSEWKVFRFFRIFFSFYFVNIFPNSGEQTRVSILAGLTFSIFRLHECARVCVLLCVREASKFENDSGHKCTQHTADIPSTGRIPSVFRRAFFSLSRCCKNSVIRMCWLGASC